MDIETTGRLTANATTTRAGLLRKLLDPRRDIDDECGYPKTITAAQYRLLYDREGVAERVVGLWPSECWALHPTIESPSSEFMDAWSRLDDEHHCYHYLHRIDTLSGIGHYGILLIGMSDGGDLNEGIKGVTGTGERDGGKEHGMLYLRAFDESQVDVAAYEAEPSNPRYGYPIRYNVTFHDPRTQESGAIATQDQTTKTVHWTRVLHVADNRTSSEVFGAPRMRPVYNRLYDLRKLLGGSAEMFWKGAFPGYSLEANDPDAELDSDSIRAEMEAMTNGLQRYMATVGISAKSLSPQVADPSAHVEAQLRAIAITLKVPSRVFQGSEQAQLASGQDARAWNRRVDQRRQNYLTPMLVRPYIDRLMLLGVLPEVDEYTVVWPDLASPTEEDKAAVAQKRTEAFAKYVAGGVDALVPPHEYLTRICGIEEDIADEIMEAAVEHILAANPDADPDQIVPPREPVSEADDELDDDDELEADDELDDDDDEQKKKSLTDNVFCPKGKGGGVDPTCSPAGATKKMAVITNTVGGVTFLTGQRKYQPAGSDAYSVSPYPQHSTILPKGTTLTKKHLSDYMKKHHSRLAPQTKGQALGTWFDKSTGKTYLDIVVVTKSKSKAIKVAKAANQKAIFSFKTMSEINTGGTGEA